MEIMLIDDDAPVVRALSRALVLLGHTVRCAHSGDEALDLLKQHCPDLAIVDLIMPGMDGIETSANIRRCCPRCRIVILTGTPDEAIGRTSLYVRPKPIDLADLRQIIEAEPDAQLA